MGRIKTVEEQRRRLESILDKLLKVDKPLRVDLSSDDVLMAEVTPPVLETTYMTHNGLNLKELFGACCNHFYKDSPVSKRVYEQIKANMPHLHEHFEGQGMVQSWMRGMTTTDRRNFFEILIANHVPLTIQTYLEGCHKDCEHRFFASRAERAEDHLQLEYSISSNTIIYLGDQRSHGIDFTLIAPPTSTFYSRKGWYIQNVTIAQLTDAQGILASDAADFFIRGRISFSRKMPLDKIQQLLIKECEKGLQEMMRKAEFNEEEAAVIAKLNLHQLTKLSRISQYLEIETEGLAPPVMDMTAS